LSSLRIDSVDGPAERLRGSWMQRRLLSIYLALCLGVSLLSCAQFVVPMQPGSAISEKPGTGLVLGRIAMIRDGEDRLISPAALPRGFGWDLAEGISGKKYVMDPLTEAGLFAVVLPAGIYHVTKIRYEDRSGLWEGTLPATFLVKTNGPIYLGTWEITIAGLGPAVPIIARTLNDLKEEQEQLEYTYKVGSRGLSAALLESAKEGSLRLVRPRSEQ
jgi:hypothetical protein